MDRRKVVYKGHSISFTSLPEQGRWAYQIDEQAIRVQECLRPPMQQAVLEGQALARAKAEIDRTEALDQALIARKLARGA